MNESTLELANELARERLESQKSAIERIETKATFLLGFAAVGSQVVVDQAGRGGWTVAALAFYGLAFLAGIASIALYEHRFRPILLDWSRRTLTCLELTCSTCCSARELRPSIATLPTPGSSGERGSLRCLR